MGIPILILGESGSGKSTSMRNFDQEEMLVFNVAGKPFPFRKQFNKVDTPTYQLIKREMSKKQYKVYVIDDSQYLLAFEMFDKAKEAGYTKFTDMAIHFKQLIDFSIKRTPPDTTIYFLHHTETADTGKIKAKTVGKMLDNQLTLEGLFSVVLMTMVEGNEHYFVTQSDGNTTCKSPMDMFDLKIGNDLKYVDERIRSYWSIGEAREPTEAPARTSGGSSGEECITQAEWSRISQAGGNNAIIIYQVMGAFGYTQPEEIKKKDVPGILREIKQAMPA